MNVNDENQIQVNTLFREMPAHRERRWELLKDFFKGWYGSLGPSDGYSEQLIRESEIRLELTVPDALREWYLLAGKRHSAWSCQDRFLSPANLRIADQKLIFYVENQAVVMWGISLESLSQEDPPVFVSDPEESKKWIEESPSVSEFALSRMVYNAKFSRSAKYSANGFATSESIATITQTFQRLAISEIHWPTSTFLYGDLGLVIETNGGSWIWISGTSKTSFSNAVELITRAGVGWEAIVENC